MEMCAVAASPISSLRPASSMEANTAATPMTAARTAPETDEPFISKSTGGLLNRATPTPATKINNVLTTSASTVCRKNLHSFMTPPNAIPIILW